MARMARMARHRVLSRCLPCLLALLACIHSVRAAAGGYYWGAKGARALGRAGAATARADDFSAVMLNPAGLARVGTTLLQLGNRVSYNRQVYTRMPTLDWSDLDQGVPRYVEFDPVHNNLPWQPLDPMMGVVSNLGLRHWGFALGVQAPAGVAKQRFPASGGQRYMMLTREAQFLYYTASVAWKLRDIVGVGATFQWIHVPTLRYELVVDATQFPGHVNPVSSELDMRASIESADPFTANAILGIWYRPLAAFELAASGQLVPAQVKAHGSLRIEPVSTEIDDDVVLTRDGKAADDVTLTMPLPLSARVGVRYIHNVHHRERFDLELDLTYETWSVVQALIMDGNGLEGELLGQRLDVGRIAIDKNWRDTIGVRVGGDFSLLPQRLTLRAGISYESAASKPAYANVDFLGARQLGASVGLSVYLRGLELALAYSHRRQPALRVRESESSVYQVVPGSQCRPPYADPLTCNEHYPGKPSAPANAGTYEAAYHHASLGVIYRF